LIKERVLAFSPLHHSASLLLEHVVLFYFLILFTLMATFLIVDSGLLPDTKLNW
jgi:hypothetical protein